jgi:hypothetical protein
MNNAFGQNNNGNVMKKIDFDQNGPNNFSPTKSNFPLSSFSPPNNLPLPSFSPPRNLPLPSYSPSKNLPTFQPSISVNRDLLFSTPPKDRIRENSPLRNNNGNVLTNGGSGLERYPLGVNPNNPPSLSPLSKALTQNVQLGQNRSALFNSSSNKQL